VLGNEDQVVLAGTGLEQVLECLADDPYTDTAARRLQAVEIIQVLMDEKLAQVSSLYLQSKFLCATGI
jgi:hypothetical protein